MVSDAPTSAELNDVLRRIDSALSRSETAARRLAGRHQQLRQVARETLADLDRALQITQEKPHG